MNIEELRAACLALPHVEEEFPFDEVTLTMRVGKGGKIFAFLPLDAEETMISLKMTPENVLETRAQYPAVQPGFHLSKKHWNQVIMDGSIPRATLLGWIKDSYDLIVSSLTKKARAELFE